MMINDMNPDMVDADDDGWGLMSSFVGLTH